MGGGVLWVHPCPVGPACTVLDKSHHLLLKVALNLVVCCAACTCEELVMQPNLCNMQLLWQQLTHC